MASNNRIEGFYRLSSVKSSRGLDEAELAIRANHPVVFRAPVSQTFERARGMEVFAPPDFKVSVRCKDAPSFIEESVPGKRHLTLTHLFRIVFPCSFRSGGLRLGRRLFLGTGFFRFGVLGRVHVFFLFAPASGSPPWCRFFFLPLLKSVSYQPLPSSRNPAAETSFLNVGHVHLEQSASSASPIFWSASSSWPQCSHQYS